MNVVEILESDAFKAGADLWVIKNDSMNKWWQELDFRSGFLFSQCLYHNKKNIPAKLTEILDLTELRRKDFLEDPDFLLLGTSAHFLNKWILLWNADSDKVSEKIITITQTQKINSIRFFSDSESIMSSIEARPKTSLIDITFIENT